MCVPPLARLVTAKLDASDVLRLFLAFKPLSRRQSIRLTFLPRRRSQKTAKPAACLSPKLDSTVFSTTSLVFLPTKIFEIKI